MIKSPQTPVEGAVHGRSGALPLLLILAALVLASFWGVWRHQFINYDDPDYVSNNPHVLSGLRADNVRWAFTTGHAGNWHPLTWLSHQLDAQLYGDRAGGPHLTNLLFHIANTVLLFLLLRYLTGSTWRSAFVTALFAVHPTHVESVAWVSERKDVLSTFFGLLAILAYAVYARTYHDSGTTKHAFRAGHAYGLALFCFALSLLAKPMLVTLPFLLLLLDYWPLERLRRAVEFSLDASRAGENPGDSLASARGKEGFLEDAKKAGRSGNDVSVSSGKSKGNWGLAFWRLIREKLPFLALSIASCVITFIVQHRGGAVQTFKTLSPGERVANAIVSYARYLQKTFWPFDLATPYPHPGRWPWFVVVGSLLLLLVISVCLWRGRHRFRAGVMGWLWFLGLLVPVIGLVQVGSQSMADRYTYLPLVGIYIALVWGLSMWVSTAGNGLTAGRGPAVLAGLGVVVVLVLALRTHNQARLWASTESLFRHAIAVSKGNWVACYNLGWELDSQKRYEEALVYYRRALEIDPGFPDPVNNIGCALAALKRFEEAIPCFEKAIHYEPNFLDARVNLGTSLQELGRLEEAVAQFEFVLARNPRHLGALNNLAGIRTKQKRYAEAVPLLEESLRQNADQPAVEYALGTTLALTRQVDAAVAHYRRAIALRPEYPEALNDLALALARQRNFSEAERLLRTGAEKFPQNAALHTSLGRVLMAQQRPAEALTEFERVVQLSPTNAEAHANLGLIYAMRGELDPAIEHLRTAVAAKPEDAIAQFNLGKALSQKGQKEEALRHLKECLRVRPGYPPAEEELRKLQDEEAANLR